MRMDTTALIASLRQDLVRAAEVGGDDAKAAAERLLLALEPAFRLTLMEALSQGAAEISEALPGVAIEVRLKGRAEALAARRGQSLNTWLVAAARAAADGGASSHSHGYGRHGRQHIQGWQK